MNEEKNILAERIYKMRKELNLTQEELASKLGLKGKSSIANYESGKITPSDEIKSKMCEVFGCTMDYLMGNSKFKNIDDTISDYTKKQYKRDVTNAIIRATALFLKSNADTYYIEKIREILLSDSNNEDKGDALADLYKNFPENKSAFKKAIIAVLDYITELESDRKYYNSIMSLKNKLSNNNKKEINKYYMCPVYGQISAGQPNWAEENIEGRLPIDTDLMDIINPEEYFFLRVNGESMNNIIRNGAFALIHKQDMVEDGEIAVVLVNGYDATLKRFTKKGDVVVLEPDSSDPSFKTQIYDKTTSIKILGKYVGKMEINK